MLLKAWVRQGSQGPAFLSLPFGSASRDTDGDDGDKGIFYHSVNFAVTSHTRCIIVRQAGWLITTS